MKKKKTVIKIILVIMLGIVGTISTFTNRTLANVDKININVDSITKETTEVITLVANTEDENIKITQIELPNGAIVNGSEIEYTTNENGIYEFEVFYEESTLESNVIESSKIISYEVTSMEKHGVIGERVKQNRVATYRAVVQSGTVGTVSWTLDDAGVLTFSGGVFPNNYYWGIISAVVANATKIVNFTAPITAGNNFNNMFYAYSNLTTINGLENLDTSNVTTMDNMFSRCSSLTNLDLSNFNTSKVTDMTGVFHLCTSLTNVDVSNFDTSNVTTMEAMFAGCTSLTNLDVTNFDTSKVTNMRGMFFNCSILKSLDVTNFNTSSVRNMAFMFANCAGLTNLDVTNFDTSNVIFMSNMFANCASLTNLDASSFNTSKVTEMEDMFSLCRNLIKLDISNFDTGNVTKMFFMFFRAPIRELILGTEFRFKFSEHRLGAPLNNAQYTGNWQFVSTGEVFTQDEFLIYDGTQPGTYVWEIRKYNVTYNTKGGSAVASEAVAYNAKVTEPTNPIKAGYTFDGWYKEDSYINKWDFNTDVMPANDITLYAKWNINSYNVTYDTKGGSAVASEAVAYNAKVTEPTNPIKTGYTFDGWYKEDSYINKWDFNTDVMPANDITLYAKWNINNAPIINAVDKILQIGDNFNPLKDVSAIDLEDGEIVLTLVNVIGNNVDTSKVGIYQVTYTVTDSNGAITTKTINVEVVEKQVIVAPIVNPKVPDTTDKTNNKPIPTGDRTNVGIWIVTLIGSIGVLGLILNKKRIAG